MASKSAASSTSSLPEISRAKPSLVEAARKTVHSPPSLLAGDSELDVRAESPSAAVLGRRASGGDPQTSGWMLKAATVPLVPRPPSPRGQPVTRRQLQYVRLARSELDHKEQAITLMRSENMQLQAKVRELQATQESHTSLQSACAGLAQRLGCSVDGVAAESVGDILQSKATSLVQDHQHLQQQLRSSRSELDGTKGEVAAANVRISSLETQLQQARAALASKEVELQQQRAQVEGLQQSNARSSASLQSLRQQLAEVEGKGQSSSESQAELHTEIGRLKSALREKDESLRAVEGQLAASQADSEAMQERITNAEAMYEDLCSQLVVALQLETTDSYDVDSLVAQVGTLSQEGPELRLRIETLIKTLKSCELDSKASRETILRLVSEVKKHQNVAAQLSELQQAKLEQESLLTAVEKERDSLQERLLAAKETMAAQEQELQAKNTRVSELMSSLESMKVTSESEREVIMSEQQKYDELCKAIAVLVGSQSTDSMELLQLLEQVVQPQQREAEEKEEEEVAPLPIQSQLAEAEEALEQERAKVKQLEGELVTHTMVKEGLSQEIKKEKEFYKKLSRALRLDSATAEVLAGDFAHDAILVRAEQLAKQETQALAEKQSAFYSAQRQLKTCRQNLESKELLLGLLQKKVAALEERVQSCNRQEAQLESMSGKGRKLEEQIERLRGKTAQQAKDIERLRSENSEMELLRRRCGEQEECIARQTARVEELSEARSEQARQLAEARLRLQSKASRERKGNGSHERELRLLQQQLSQSRETEQQLSAFRLAVQRLLADSEEAKGEPPTDYDLIAKLENLLATNKRHEETVKCLGSSLQQLEQGFKTGYTDTLTILQTKA